MKRIVACILLALAAPAFAQDAVPTVESISQQANDTIAALREQRIQSEDQDAQLRIELARTRRELARAQAEIAALKAAVY